MYCSECGKAMEEKKVCNGYDESTGERRYLIRSRCPKLKDIFGFFPVGVYHDETFREVRPSRYEAR